MHLCLMLFALSEDFLLGNGWMANKHLETGKLEHRELDDHFLALLAFRKLSVLLVI